MFKNLQNKRKLITTIAEGLFVGIFFITALIQVFFFSDFLVKLEKLAAVLPGVLVMMTNNERTHESLHTLSENTQLKEAAQLKANDMASKGYFAHTSPEGKTPWYWLDLVGYPYIKAGENLAVNFVLYKKIPHIKDNSSRNFSDN